MERSRLRASTEMRYALLNLSLSSWPGKAGDPSKVKGWHEKGDELKARIKSWWQFWK